MHFSSCKIIQYNLSPQETRHCNAKLRACLDWTSNKWLLCATGYCSSLKRWIANPWLLILNSHILKLKCHDTRIEFWGSSWDCQLIFERYCTFLHLDIIILIASIWTTLSAVFTLILEEKISSIQAGNPTSEYSTRRISTWNPWDAK